MNTHTGHFDSGWAFWKPVALRAPGFPAAEVARLSSPLLAKVADALADGPDAKDETWSAYRGLFESETSRLSSVIRDLAQEPRFQLAIAWQNHRAFDTAIAPILRNVGALARRNSKHRAHEELIANYWQRYCLKNDTIGFFGPVGWASMDAAAAQTRLVPGRELVSNVEVFFEAWAVDRLAETIAAEPGMAVWVPPRRTPFIRLDGQQVIRPVGPPVPLSALEAAVLSRVDGIASAHQIASEVAATCAQAATPDDVLAILGELRRRRLVSWKLELPLSPRPERYLRRFLDTVGDPALAADGLARLGRLESARGGVGAASADGDPDRMVRALRALDETFVEVTGAAPSRNSGKAYAGRTLVYHDARRDVDLALGADFITALAPIELLLQSARWLTYQFGVALNAEFRDIADRLAARQGWPVSLASFWFECLSLLHKSAHGVVDRLLPDFQQRWADILRFPRAEPRVRLHADALAAQVREAFDAPRSGWTGGRYYSPDVMIAAADAEAIRRGEFEVILGEFHIAIATFRHYCFVTQHPSPDELFACLTADSPGPRLLPVQPKEGAGRLTIRTQPALTRDEDFMVALFDQAVDAGRPRLLRAADLSITPAADGLRIAVPGGHCFDVMDVFSELLTNVIMDRFAIFPKLQHLPRVSIDRLVISRETWRFAVGTLAFADKLDEAERFAAARQWRRQMSLPGQVFVKVPGELKPFFLDFESPAYVNLLAKSVRRLRAMLADGSLRGEADGANTLVQFSEMLPAAQDLWLTDSAGNRYTSELRLVAVDLRGPVPGLVDHLDAAIAAS
jgi:hypothetical protein